MKSLTKMLIGVVALSLSSLTLAGTITVTSLLELAKPSIDVAKEFDILSQARLEMYAANSTFDQPGWTLNANATDTLKIKTVMPTGDFPKNDTNEYEKNLRLIRGNPIFHL